MDPFPMKRQVKTTYGKGALQRYSGEQIIIIRVGLEAILPYWAEKYFKFTGRHHQ